MTLLLDSDWVEALRLRVDGAGLGELADRYQVSKSSLNNMFRRLNGGTQPKTRRVCKECGEEYRGMYSQVYCGDDCHVKADKRLEKAKRVDQKKVCESVERVCRTCGERFTGPKLKRYCRPECRDSHPHHKTAAPIAPLPKKTCPSCGVEFSPTSIHSDKVYCSEKCRRRNHRRGRTRKPKMISKVCELCGSAFECDSRYRTKRRFCSKSCASKRRPVRGPIVKMKCEHCNTEYECTEMTSSHRKYCSKACARRADHRTRRAKQRNAFIAPVFFRQVAIRSGWRCGICGKPVPEKATVPNPLAPTLDHIIPLAKGGTHEPKNVQLAHFLCNSIKGDRVSSAN